MKITNFERQKMLPLTDKENKYHRLQKLRYVCRDKFNNNEKRYWKVQDHCHYTGKYRGTAYIICNRRYKNKNEFLVVYSQLIEL